MSIYNDHRLEKAAINKSREGRMTVTDIRKVPVMFPNEKLHPFE
jgi:hypothetical protein